MRPENAQRRTIIRKWMALAPAERQSREHAERFASKTVAAGELRCSGNPHHKIMAWLLPRTGRR